MWYLCPAVFLLLALAPGQQPEAQERLAPCDEQQESRTEFFSGRILSVSEAKLTVVRYSTESERQERTFALTSATKIEGTLKVRARVTVGYQADEGRDVATRVIVRAQ